MFTPPPPRPETTPPPAAAPHPDELPVQDNVCAYVAECLVKGSTPQEIRKQLLVLGHTPQEIDAILDVSGRSVAPSSFGEETRAVGRRNMFIGFGVAMIGLTVTCGSLAAGDGRGIIAWGAILWGAIQFCRGLSEANRQD
jgi:hypothetical protein